MTILITSDTHFTSKPQDDYRWDLWPWLRRMVKKHNVSTILLLGDLTDAKDRHDAVLVNRLVDELWETSGKVSVVALKANHDYVDEDNPFFRFTRHISGITYVSEPLFTLIDGVRVALLPNTRDHVNAWKDLDFTGCHWVFCHQTFDGAIAENGARLGGIPPSCFDSLRSFPPKCKVISGDIHVPQVVSKRITYVGAPYRVRFGDAFTPRVLLLEAGEPPQDLHLPTVSREVIDISADAAIAHNFPKGTQIKIKVHLKRQEFGEKDRIRADIQKIVDKRGWVLCGVEWKLVQVQGIREEVSATSAVKPADIVRAYAKEKKLEKSSIDLGVSFVKEAAGG